MGWDIREPTIYSGGITELRHREERPKLETKTGEKTGNEIRLYTGSYCPYCLRVQKELDRLELPYEPVNADEDGREEVIRLSGQQAIPIMTIGDEVLVDSGHIIRELRRRFE